MKPSIDQTGFGSITIEGICFEHDVLIRLNGQIEKRKKKLSKAIYGTSHIVSQAEAERIYEKGVKRLILGTGQYNSVTLSPEAAEYFQRKHCQVESIATPKAILAWNTASGAVIGLFHVTC
ncbi:MAG TPA: MTH938/NDUFAF3 family protein [Ktedonobacterales bacterium]|nr:MTH938/NDUFAF3 family protein [Ktedonobacterales bacterium]